jgi:hypothetical protein
MIDVNSLIMLYSLYQMGQGQQGGQAGGGSALGGMQQWFQNSAGQTTSMSPQAAMDAAHGNMTQAMQGLQGNLTPEMKNGLTGDDANNPHIPKYMRLGLSGLTKECQDEEAAAKANGQHYDYTLEFAHKTQQWSNSWLNYGADNPNTLNDKSTKALQGVFNAGGQYVNASFDWYKAGGARVPVGGRS